MREKVKWRMISAGWHTLIAVYCDAAIAAAVAGLMYAAGEPFLYWWARLAVMIPLCLGILALGGVALVSPLLLLAWMSAKSEKAHQRADW